MTFQHFLHINVQGCKFDPAVKRLNVNLRLPFEKKMVDLESSTLYIPRFSPNTFLVLEKKNFSVFTIHGHGDHLV